MKREFKDLIRMESYEYLNSEITGDYDEAHAVKCLNGTFVGTEENGVVSWLGIPYAKPPVGERRFKAPEYVDAGDRIFEAKYYGKGAFGSTGYPDCAQKLESEDCLYLNICGHCRGFLTQQSGNQPSKSVKLFCNSSLVRAEKEAVMNIVDCDRTCFMTRYYVR